MTEPDSPEELRERLERAEMIDDPRLCAADLMGVVEDAIAAYEDALEVRAAGCQCGDDEACRFVRERDEARAERDRLRELLHKVSLNDHPEGCVIHEQYRRVVSGEEPNPDEDGILCSCGSLEAERYLRSGEPEERDPDGPLYRMQGLEKSGRGPEERGD